MNEHNSIAQKLFIECRTPQHGKLTQKKDSCTKVKDSKFLCIAYLDLMGNICAQNHKLGLYSYIIHKKRQPLACPDSQTDSWGNNNTPRGGVKMPVPPFSRLTYKSLKYFSVSHT